MQTDTQTMNQLHSSLESNSVEDLQRIYGNRKGGACGEMDSTARGVLYIGFLIKKYFGQFLKIKYLTHKWITDTGFVKRIEIKICATWVCLQMRIRLSDVSYDLWSLDRTLFCHKISVLFNAEKTALI